MTNKFERMLFWIGASKHRIRIYRLIMKSLGIMFNLVGLYPMAYGLVLLFRFQDDFPWRSCLCVLMGFVLGVLGVFFRDFSHLFDDDNRDPPSEPPPSPWPQTPEILELTYKQTCVELEKAA